MKSIIEFLCFSEKFLLYELHTTMNTLYRLCLRSFKGFTISLVAGLFLVSNMAFTVHAQISGVTAPVVPITGPEQDCGAALPIADSVFVQPNVYRGLGRTQDLNQSSCIGIERNSVWYRVVMPASGRFGFTLEPQNPNDDFDWAVYRIPVGRTWADIPADSNGSLQVSCNFAASFGATGPNGRGNMNRQDGDGSPFNALIPVNAGEVYFIVVNTSVPAQSGYRLNFTPSSFVNTVGAASSRIFHADTTKPRLSVFTADQNSCGVFTLAATFSEYIRCASVQPSDFTLLTPFGQSLAITGVAAPRCAAATNNFDTTYTLTLAQPINETGTYSLAVSNVTTLTGITLQSSTSQSLSFPTLRPRISGEGVTTGPTGTVALVCTGGTIVLDAGGGYVRYIWSTSPTMTLGTSGNAGVVSDDRVFVTSRPATYYVLVQDKNGCLGRASVSVQNRTDGIKPVIQSFAYLCNQGSAYIGLAGQYASYRWSTGDTNAAINATQPGVYSVTVRDFGGCIGTASVTVERRFDSIALPAQVSGILQFCEGSSTTLETNRFMANYQWFLNGDSLRMADNVPMADRYRLTVTRPGVYRVRINNNGCTFESPSVTVRMNPLPTQPVVTQRGNLLGSSPSQSYQWLTLAPSGSTPINGATSREFVAPRDGRYAVQITDSNGCQAVSPALDVRRSEGFARLRVGTVTGDVGRIVEIPIYLDSARNLEATGVSSFAATLRMSAQLLAPMDNRLKDSLANNERFIRVTLPVRPVDANGLLDKFRFLLIRGTTTASVLSLQSVTPLPVNIGVSVTTATGFVALNPRVTTPSGSALQEASEASESSTHSLAPLVECQPNPAMGGAVSLKYILPQDDTVTVSLTDAMGSTIKTYIASKMTTAGEHSLAVNADELKTGTYFIVVRTPRHITTSRLTVLR
jgi:hypothetical protein